MKIRETSYGIPHILADDLPGAAAGAGYVAARDYGCILLDQIVRVRSERAKFFGPGDKDANTNSDFAMLTLAIATKGAEGLAAQTDDVQKALYGERSVRGEALDKVKDRVNARLAELNHGWEVATWRRQYYVLARVDAGRPAAPADDRR